MKFKYIPKENDVVIDCINNIVRKENIELPNEITSLIYDFKINIDVGLEYEFLIKEYGNDWNSTTSSC